MFELLPEQPDTGSGVPTSALVDAAAQSDPMVAADPDARELVSRLLIGALHALPRLTQLAVRLARDYPS